MPAPNCGGVDIDTYFIMAWIMAASRSSSRSKADKCFREYLIFFDEENTSTIVPAKYVQIQASKANIGKKTAVNFTENTRGKTRKIGVDLLSTRTLVGVSGKSKCEL